MTIETAQIQKDVRLKQQQAAQAWRKSVAERGIFCINMISSPGAGKTSLLQAMARHWTGKHKMSVLVGDIATNRDAERLAPYMPVIQLTTGGACHLDLSLVRQGWERLESHQTEFLIIENVGNLVCPASHDLGEHLRVVVLSVTEGDDKPGKYPKAFRTSQACVISKTDLLAHVPFSMTAVIEDAHAVQPDLAVFATSALKEDGIAEWCDYLSARREIYLQEYAEQK